MLQIKVNFEDNPLVLDAVLGLLKKIFCIDRSVSKDPYSGQSKELDQSIEIALYSAIILDLKKQPETLLNVILTACEPANDFIQSLLKALPSFMFIENHADMLDFLFKWISLKSDYMLKRGV